MHNILQAYANEEPTKPVLNQAQQMDVDIADALRGQNSHEANLVNDDVLVAPLPVENPVLNSEMLTGSSSINLLQDMMKPVAVNETG